MRDWREAELRRTQTATILHDNPSRQRLVDGLQQQGYALDSRVARALRTVPRELFIDPKLASRAYDDSPLPIGHGQTISAPHMVAYMADQLELRPGLKILEVGAGSGYHAAIMARCIGPDGSLLSVEYEPNLASLARRNLANAGIQNVTVRTGDGAEGSPEDAPFDRIYLTCAAPAIPPVLMTQLARDGILLAPVGIRDTRLIRLHKDDGHWIETDLGACAFVPLRGRKGAAA